MSAERSRSPAKRDAGRAGRLRNLGTSSIKCTTLGFGGAPLGDLFQRLPDDQCLDSVHKAAGIVNYFDTAPWYGLGLSENRMGFALRQHARGSYTLSTKVGRTLDPVQDSSKWDSMGFAGGLQFSRHWDYSYNGFRQQHRESLQRLGHGSVDCLVIHDLEEAEEDSPQLPLREQLREGGLRALEELRRDKVIRAFGAGLNSAEGRDARERRKWNRDYVDFLLGAPSSGERPVDFFLMAGIHTLLNHSAFEDGLLSTCEDHGIGVVIGGAFNSGILATGAVKGATYDYEIASDEIMDRVKAIEHVCSEHKVPLPAAALQYSAGHKVVSTVIAGVKSPYEVERARDQMNIEIPVEFWESLMDGGLLPKGLPLPDPR